ncbi:putative large extracellular alpha-helical protein [Escherichia coli]|uniref:Putative large extracellular alpha-helical protein n=1 Tax=Escherichia coli TaxID=562 RepID=A0A2X1K3B5_ECOLX|nr:putative large extracellular alpha-helical protein [Escherichia coli]
MGELAYMVPVKELTERSLSAICCASRKKGNSFCLLLRYVRSYAPAQQSVAAGSEWTGMQVK